MLRLQPAIWALVPAHQPELRTMGTIRALEELHQVPLAILTTITSGMATCQIHQHLQPSVVNGLPLRNF